MASPTCSGASTSASASGSASGWGSAGGAAGTGAFGSSLGSTLGLVLGGGFGGASGAEIVVDAEDRPRRNQEQCPAEQQDDADDSYCDPDGKHSKRRLLVTFGGFPHRWSPQDQTRSTTCSWAADAS